LTSPLSHRATKSFWRLYSELPEDIRDLADKTFVLLRSDPFHPSLHFKTIKNPTSGRPVSGCTFAPSQSLKLAAMLGYGLAPMQSMIGLSVERRTSLQHRINYITVISRRILRGPQEGRAPHPEERWCLLSNTWKPFKPAGPAKEYRAPLPWRWRDWGACRAGTRFGFRSRHNAGSLTRSRKSDDADQRG
jgi:hypothetical protein